MYVLEKLVLDNRSSLRDVMDFCLQSRVYFPALAHIARRETDKQQPVTRTKHYIGRLATYLKTARVMVDGAFELPCILSNYQLRVCQSSQYRQLPLDPGESTLDGIVHRMFPESSADEVHADLERLNIFGNMAERLKFECNFRTRVHAELLLADKFRSNGYGFYASSMHLLLSLYRRSPGEVHNP